MDVSHGPLCPRGPLELALDSSAGNLIRRCFLLMNSKELGITLVLSDLTEEEFQVMHLIHSERQKQMKEPRRE